MSKWPMVKVGNHCTLKSGNSLPDEILNNNGDTPYVKVGDLNLVENTPFVVTSTRFVNRQNIEKQIFPIGTVIFPKRGGAIGTNKKRLTVKEICADLNIMGVIPKEKLLPRYLYYFFENIDMSVISNGTSVPQINNGDIAPLLIPLPPLDEQRKITTTLDAAVELLRLRKEQLAELDKHVKSQFIEIFGDLKSNHKKWQIEPFKKFAFIDGNMTTDYEKFANYPHIGIDSIEKNTGELKGYRTVKEDGVISGKYIFTPEHLIYSKIRPNLNKVALPNFTGLCSADAYPILPNKQNCNRIFLAMAMRSRFFLDYILQYSTRTNLPKVNREQIAGFKLPLPPLHLQEQFAAFFHQVDKSKHLIQQSIDETQRLFDSLMSEYFE